MSAAGKLPRWAELALLPLINLVVALLLSGVVVRMLGESPWTAFKLLASGALGTQEGIGYTLYYATNFIFTGLAVAVAFHAGLFNIGGEGQAYIGGLGCGLAALALDRYPFIPDATLRYPLRSDLALPQVRTPVLLVHGTVDTLIPPAHSAALQALTPHARTVLIGGAGHSDIHQHPAYLALLKQALAGPIAT